MGKKEKKDKKEKPLDKMTATELRKYALELGGITGVHGMNKEELLAAIKQVKGIVDEGKKAVKTANMRELKQKRWAVRWCRRRAAGTTWPGSPCRCARRSTRTTTAIFRSRTCRRWCWTPPRSRRGARSCRNCRRCGARGSSPSTACRNTMRAC
jgi:hypothetical protein